MASRLRVDLAVAGVVVGGDRALVLPEVVSEAPHRVVYASFGRRARKLSVKSTSRILLLQGPVGPFFKSLQNSLNENGFDAWRICFTAGDKFYSNKKKRITFSEGLNEWPSWLDQLLSYSNVDCIVLFGCERPIHSLAIEVARKRNIPVVSLEEGYVRPGFITVEHGGNNRRSPFASRMAPAEFDSSDTIKPYKCLKSPFTRMCRLGFFYYLANFMSSPDQRRTFHKNRSLTSEAFYWSRNLFRKIVHQGRNFELVQRLLEHHDKKYFIVPLQVSDDSQLREAANGWTNEKIIISSISSFARHAPKNMRLVFKIHPLERGHSAYDKLVHSLADLNGVSDRIDILDTGSVGLLVRHAAGMLTINSTSGLSAIAHAIPLMTLGETIYSQTPLSYAGHTAEAMDKFWTRSFVQDRAACHRYLVWLRQNCLKPGDFYAKDGISVGVKGVTEVINASLNSKSIASIDAQPTMDDKKRLKRV